MHICYFQALYEPHHEKICLQQRHPLSLISTCVIGCLDSTIPIVAVSKIPRLFLASVAEEAGLSLTWSHNSRGRFSHDMAQEPPHDKSNKMTCAPTEDSDQPGHPPRLISVFAICSVGSYGPSASSCGQRRLIRVGRCPG